MIYSRIVGVGAHLPEQSLSNDDLRRYVETTDDWVISRTGIRSRRIAKEGESASDLALPAAKAALTRAGISAKDIDLIVFATTTPDRIYPSTACLLQHKLGVGGFAAFDVQAVCSGFVYALATADSFIRAGRATRALVVGGEIYSRILDWSDRATCVLFGDGAGAAVLIRDSAPGILSVELGADGAHADKLTVPAYVSRGKIYGDPFTRMDGKAVFRFAVDAMSDAVRRALSTAKISMEDINWLVPHQANLRIIEALARKLSLPMERVIVTVDEHANTSAASIPLALAARREQIRPNDLVMMTTVGGGFTWGAALIRW